MSKLINLTKRNIKVYFTDRGMVFTSLITPLILLVLYATFLANVYENSFLEMIPKGVDVSKKLIDGLVSSQLVGSLLSVSCITVAFCSNMLMVQDKLNGIINDLNITPIDKRTLAISYFLASFVSTLIVNVVGLSACLIYVAISGWFMTFMDVLFILLNVVLLTLFGCIMSSLVNSFLSTQGQISAVSGIVSSMYGFICGAYMPISQFGTKIKNILLYSPSTYGTSIIKSSVMRGPLRELGSVLPTEAINIIRENLDIRLILSDNVISLPVMYVIVGGTILLLFGLYVVRSSLNKES